MPDDMFFRLRNGARDPDEDDPWGECTQPPPPAPEPGPETYDPASFLTGAALDEFREGRRGLRIIRLDP